MVPFQGRSLVLQNMVLQNTTRSLVLQNTVLQNTTRVFPCHAPTTSFGTFDAFVHAPETPRTYTDMKHAICARHGDVATVCTINLQIMPHPKADHWFPLQGGKCTQISNEEIDRVCGCIESETADAILLHCYHGLNRTLLVLAALYLRQEFRRGNRRTVGDALHRVRTIRPPGIVRGQTVDALKEWWKQHAR